MCLSRTGRHSSSFKSFAAHMCEGDSTQKTVHRSVLLQTSETKIVWMSEKVKVWRHRSRFPNRLISVIPQIWEEE
ncbi:hypothetical protein TNCV_2894861 [Trichonephila clavipes]|nr:hypothetical protein TNCV_2894861 [Trichonephila clavipes]